MALRRSVLLPCFLLGACGGMRTFMPVTAVAWHRRPFSPSTRLLSAVAVGELVFDKLPQAPSRLDPPGLIARAVTAAVAGTTLRGAPGGLVATLAALVTAPAAHNARRALVRDRGAPDWVLGAGEDGLAIGLAAAALRAA